MKEATGELNMTVITVVAIVAVGAFFTIFLWPRIKGSIEESTKCASAVCPCSTPGRCQCTYYESGSDVGETVYCDVK